MELIYQKGNPQLDEEFSLSQPFGRVRVGTRHLFWKKHLRWHYLPISQVVRAYRRVEEVNGKTGCCSNDFSIHKLMLVTESGTLMEILIGDSLYRQEPERLMEAMRQQWPTLLYQKEDAPRA